MKGYSKHNYVITSRWEKPYSIQKLRHEVEQHLTYSNEERLKSLMLKALDGNATAYRDLLNELARVLEAYFKRRLHERWVMDAQDLVQDTLLAIHTRRITYNRDMALLPWVKGIANYKLVDFLRQRRHKMMTLMEEDLPTVDVSSSINARLDVDRILSEIPEPTSTLIRSVRVEGLSIEDAAHLSGLSQSAVKVAIHRGLSKLIRRFGGK